MSGVDVRVAVAQIAADQWGLLTTAQAAEAGVTRMMLSRMAERGELERVVQGVYATPSAAGDELTQRRAVWLSLDPRVLAYERLATPEDAGVISHASAAAMHDIGDILETQVEVTLRTRYRSGREELRAHRGTLEAGEVTLVEGLPVTTPARTVADLLRVGHDQDHVATVVADALRRDLTTVRELQRALDGVRSGRSGVQMLSDLLAAAGLDEESLSRSIMTSKVGTSALAEVARALFLDVPRTPTTASLSAATSQRNDELRMILTNLLETQGAPFDSVWKDFDAKSRPRLPVPKLDPELYQELLETWRALELSQQTAAGRDDHDDDEGEGGNSEVTT